MAVTTNKNFLSPTGFKFTMDASKYPNLEYFCSSINLPAVGIGSVDQPYRAQTLSVVGDRMSFEDLSLTFNVTENMENYIETFDWMKRMLAKDGVETCDATLSILSSHNNVTRTIRFKDCFPDSLSGFEFVSTATEIEYIQATVNFKFNEFEFI